MTKNVVGNWDAERVDCPSTSVAKLVTRLRGGQSITLKSLAGSGKDHYIGPNNSVTSSKCYLLESGETLTLTLPIIFGENKEIEIWVLPEVAGEDVCFVKLIGMYPSTEGST